MNAASNNAESLRRQWEEHMELGHDSLPPWYWSRPEREARRDAWVAERLKAQPSPPDPAVRAPHSTETEPCP